MFDQILNLIKSLNLSKNSLYIIITILLSVVGYYIYNDISNKSASNKDLEDRVSKLEKNTIVLIVKYDSIQNGKIYKYVDFSNTVLKNYVVTGDQKLKDALLLYINLNQKNVKSDIIKEILDISLKTTVEDNVVPLSNLKSLNETEEYELSTIKSQEPEIQQEIRTIEKDTQIVESIKKEEPKKISTIKKVTNFFGLTKETITE